MAIETEVKQNFGARLGGALKGVGESIQNGIQLADKLKTAQTQRDALGQQMEQNKQQMEIQKLEVQQGAVRSQISTARQLASIQDPKKRKTIAASLVPNLEKTYNVLGIPSPGPEAILTMASDFAEEQSQFFSLIENANSVAQNNPESFNSAEFEQKLNALSYAFPAETFKHYSNTLIKEVKGLQAHGVAKQAAAAETAKIEQEAKANGLVQTKLVDGKKTFEKAAVDDGSSFSDLTKDKTDFVKNLATDPQMKDYETSLSAVGAARQLTLEALDNPQAAGALPRKLARLSGEVGMMTDKDVADFQLKGTGTIPQRVESHLKALFVGGVTEKEQEFVTKLTDRMEENLVKIRNKRVNQLGTQRARAANRDPREYTSLVDPITAKPINPPKGATENAAPKAGSALERMRQFKLSGTGKK